MPKNPDDVSSGHRERDSEGASAGGLAHISTGMPGAKDSGHCVHGATWLSVAWSRAVGNRGAGGSCTRKKQLSRTLLRTESAGDRSMPRVLSPSPSWLRAAIRSLYCEGDTTRPSGQARLVRATYQGTGLVAWPVPAIKVGRRRKDRVAQRTFVVFKCIEHHATRTPRGRCPVPDPHAQSEQHAPDGA